MGVNGSHCQLCRLPVNHDHYVPSRDGGGMLKIYRGGSADGGHRWEDGEHVVRFSSEHAWLAEVVALNRLPTGPRIIRGTVEDGMLTDATTGDTALVMEGGEDAFALHEACWQRSGSPRDAAEVVAAHGTHPWAVIEAYDEQLFAMHDFVVHGPAWALVDPRGTSAAARRSSERIDALLALARRPMPSPRPRSVAEVLASDRGWRGLMLRDAAHAPTHAIHYRADLHPGLDVGAFPVLIWAMSEYPDGGFPPPALAEPLAAFERGMKAAVETDGEAVVVLVCTGQGQGRYLIQARDEATTRARIDAVAQALGLPIDYDNERDPTWRVFFEQMHPARHLDGQR